MSVMHPGHFVVFWRYMLRYMRLMRDHFLEDNTLCLP